MKWENDSFIEFIRQYNKKQRWKETSGVVFLLWDKRSLDFLRPFSSKRPEVERARDDKGGGKVEMTRRLMAEGRCPWSLALSVYTGIPRFGSLGTDSGDVSFGRVGSIAVQVADDGVDLNDDVLGNLGLYGLFFYHLFEGNNQTRHGQLPHQESANCHIKIRPTATLKVVDFE